MMIYKINLYYMFQFTKNI